MKHLLEYIHLYPFSTRMYKYHIQPHKCTVDFFFQNYILSFVCFDALRPKSTAMAMVRGSVHLTTLFPGQA